MTIGERCTITRLRISRHRAFRRLLAEDEEREGCWKISAVKIF